MTTLALAALILRLQGLPVAPGPAEVRARILAATIASEAARYDLPAEIVAAVAMHESGFRRDAIGARGEAGYMQLLRGTLATAGYDHVSDAGLMNPRLNFHLGARHLAHVRRLCGNAPPVAWLSVYSGRRHCRPSPYSRAVLKLLERAQPPEVAAQ